MFIHTANGIVKLSLKFLKSGCTIMEYDNNNTNTMLQECMYMIVRKINTQQLSSQIEIQSITLTLHLIFQRLPFLMCSNIYATICNDYTFTNPSHIFTTVLSYRVTLFTCASNRIFQDHEMARG